MARAARNRPEELIHRAVAGYLGATEKPHRGHLPKAARSLLLEAIDMLAGNPSAKDWCQRAASLLSERAWTSTSAATAIAIRDHREKLLETYLRNVPIRPQNGCWNWLGAAHKRGKHGVVSLPRQRARAQAHRVYYQLIHGVIADDLVVRHRCDNPRCCNPDHLEIGTQQDNIRDCVDRRRNRVPPPRSGENHPRAKLTAQQVLQIRKRFTAGETSSALAREYGVAQATLYAAATGKAWRDAA